MTTSTDQRIEQPAYGSDGHTPYAAPQPAGAVRRGGRRAGGAALLAAACLASGATGAGLTLLADGSASATPAATITRGTATAVSVGAGTAQAAAAEVGPSVVTIAVTGSSASVGSFGRTQAVSDTGSGIVLRSDGYVVTNNHVVAAAADGGTVSVTFSDGTTSRARVVGTDATSDLAVLKVDGKSGLRAATFADSDQLAVGQPVLAIGAPLGLANTVTEGIVSTLHRPVRTGEAGASAQSVLDAVQTDAAINPGNSGGALVDLAGQVVGVNSAIASTGSSASGQSGNIGVGFAIPSNDVAEVAEELIADGHATHPQLGVSAGDAASAADGTPGRGAAVQQVASGGPADQAGLRSGDIITKVDDRTVTDADSLIVAIRAHQPGDVVTLTYTRGGATETAKAKLVTASTS